MIYVYFCAVHGEIEQNYPMGQQPEKILCPECQKEARRVFSVPAVHYKGFGWDWSKSGVRHGDPDMDTRKREGLTPNARKTGYH